MFSGNPFFSSFPHRFLTKLQTAFIVLQQKLLNNIYQIYTEWYFFNVFKNLFRPMDRLTIGDQSADKAMSNFLYSFKTCGRLLLGKSFTVTCSSNLWKILLIVAWKMWFSRYLHWMKSTLHFDFAHYLYIPTISRLWYAASLIYHFCYFFLLCYNFEIETKNTFLIKVINVVQRNATIFFLFLKYTTQKLLRIKLTSCLSFVWKNKFTHR